MISIGNYNPGRPSPDTVWVNVAGVTVYYSYQDPIAFTLGSRLMCNETVYSATTSKHLRILKQRFKEKTYYHVESDFKQHLYDAVRGATMNHTEDL